MNSKESHKIISIPTYTLSDGVWASANLLAMRDMLLCRTEQCKATLHGICKLSLAVRTVKYPEDVLRMLWNNIKITMEK